MSLFVRIQLAVPAELRARHAVAPTGTTGRSQSRAGGRGGPPLRAPWRLVWSFSTAMLRILTTGGTCPSRRTDVNNGDDCQRDECQSGCRGGPPRPPAQGGVFVSGERLHASTVGLSSMDGGRHICRPYITPPHRRARGSVPLTDAHVVVRSDSVGRSSRTTGEACRRPYRYHPTSPSRADGRGGPPLHVP